MTSIVNTALAFARSLNAYEAELSTRSKELKDCAERFCKPGFKPAAQSSRPLAWFEELENVREVLAGHRAQVEASSRLEALVELGEAAVRDVERALQQIEDVAVVRHGYVQPQEEDAIPANGFLQPNNSKTPPASPSCMSDPPTPPLLGMRGPAGSRGLF